MTLRLLLGDQLSHTITSLQDIDPSKDIVLMCEVWEEATYVKHHKKKIAFLFSAMRHFAQELEEKSYQVRYTRLNDADNAGSFSGEVSRAVKDLQPERIVVTMPGEYRVLQAMESWEEELGLPVEIRPDERFLSTPEEFAEWAKGRKQLRMEYFYREMRRKHKVLMDGDDPVGGKWNYDDQNREPPREEMSVPEPYNARIDETTQEVIDLVADRFDDHFGDLEPFYFAVTRSQALYALDKFIEERLPRFGDYQDAMLEEEPWMYHSHLSFYINCGLLEPLECIRKAEAAFRNSAAPLNATEGFIRQILGWREYVRGIYWMEMPVYENENYLEATRPLPYLYWGDDTHMNCMKQCVSETRRHAYAHHIQRLMVLGNFALIAGLHPDEVNEWYLIVYADAYQWVELPNVSGMILFADGGLLASKPYAASGAYINKMSNYCENCYYDVKKKNGERACPFNYLYWDFLMRNEDKLRENNRLRMIYSTLKKMSPERLEAIDADARRFFKAMENEEKI